MKSNSCKSLVFRLDFHTLFSFNSLMEAFVVTAPVKHTAGMLVNDEDFPALHDIILIAQEKFLGFDGIVEIADQGCVARFIKVINAQVILNFSDP